MEILIKSLDKEKIDDENVIAITDDDNGKVVIKNG